MGTKQKKNKFKLFALMPFREEFDDVYMLIKDAAIETEESLATNIYCSRADEILGPGKITDQIIQAISEADIIVADISDNNPNVMYELGLAHTMKKASIIISQDVHNSPFDVKDFRMILYNRNRLVKDLRHPLASSLKNMIAGGLTATGSVANKLDGAPKPPETSNVFISYSHVDSDVLNRVLVHLKPLEKQGMIDLWVDTRIKAGEKWEERIKNALSSAKVAILLVSADFLASDFIVDNELPPLLSAAEQDGTKILPVIVKPSRFLRDENLAKFQAVNDPQIPVIKMSEVEREELFVRVAEIVEFYHK
jgi:nucleoside 2-deoxyribosyltransferase